MTERILSIAGKTGLFKLISQGKNMLIVEEIATGKRRPAYMRDKVMSLSVLVLIIIIASCVPGNLIISFFAVLPVYAVLIFYKASRYMAIRQDCESKFLCLGIGSVLIVPLFLYWILKLILMLR